MAGLTPVLCEIVYCLDPTLSFSAVLQFSLALEDILSLASTPWTFTIVPNAHQWCLSRDRCHMYPGKMDELTFEGLNLIIHDTVTFTILLDSHISTDFLP